MFKNRKEAGALLAQAIEKLGLKDPVLLGIPRGGLVLAAEAARLLRCDLDMVLVRKIGLPGDPECALGAVDENGQAVWNCPLDEVELLPGYVDGALKEAAALLRRRRLSYCPGRAAIPLKGRNVVVVDDGVATGASMIAALELLRRQEPACLVAAAAVAPLGSERKLDAVADRVLILETPAQFRAVGEFFDEFGPVGDTEAGALMRGAPEAKV